MFKRVDLFRSSVLRVAARVHCFDIGRSSFPTSGDITIGGATPRQARLNREIGFVFQEAALLEWRRIGENIALPLELRGVSRAERMKRPTS